MSYGIAIFPRAVKAAVERGADLENAERPPFETQQITAFVESLIDYGYQPAAGTSDRHAFAKKVDGCPVQVSIFASEIGFSVPYWENSREAIFTALQDATEICNLETMAIYEPQTGEWISDFDEQLDHSQGVNDEAKKSTRKRACRSDSFRRLRVP